MDRLMSIGEILSQSDESFEFALGAFLEGFYHASALDMEMLLRDEPCEKKGMEEKAAFLAAAAQQLAKEYQIAVPTWVLKRRFFLEAPYYALNTQNEEFRQFLRETSPEEYASRNVFFGDNLLKRV